MNRAVLNTVQFQKNDNISLKNCVDVNVCNYSATAVSITHQGAIITLPAVNSNGSPSQFNFSLSGHPFDIELFLEFYGVLGNVLITYGTIPNC